MKQSYNAHRRVAPKIARTGPDGFVYDSKAEYQRWAYLDLMQRGGLISDLQRQVKFELKSGDTKVMTRRGIAKYTPDFVYMENGQRVIEDVKGYRDENSKFRIRVFEALYKCKVAIVMKKGNSWIVEE